MLNGLFQFPQLYRFMQWSLYRKGAYRWYVDRCIRPQSGDRVLDIGCGMGSVLEYLPQVQYEGFDSNPKYIGYAKKKYSSKGNFYCRKIDETCGEIDSKFDVVMANACIHHLNDDDTLTLLRNAHKALKPGGRLVTLDGCYVNHQKFLAKYLLKNDRGKYVRTRDGYLQLFESVFSKVETQIRHDMLRVPYTLIIGECMR